jgi:hypothetical protein
LFTVYPSNILTFSFLHAILFVELMKNRIIALVVGIAMLLFSSVQAQITFERWYGGISREVGHSLAQTSDGGYIIAGHTYSMGVGECDVYLLKTDSLGNETWSKTYGGSSYDWGYSVAQTSDGGYIISGATQSFGSGLIDVYLIKTDASGDTNWTRTYGGLHMDSGESVIQTFDDGYIIVGWTDSYSIGLSDVYLIKTDSIGDTLWTKTYGDSLSEWASSVIQNSDGGYTIAGVTYSFGAGLEDVYLLRTNSSGDTAWSRTYGSSGYDWGLSVIRATDGGYVIAGWTDSFGAGFYDVYLIKVDFGGDTVWTRTYGGSGYDEARSISKSFDEGYIVAGQTRSYGAGSDDIYLIKLDANGDSLWTRTFGGNDRDWAESVVSTSDGGCATVGGTQSFGAGTTNVYLIKADTLGNVGVTEQPSLPRKPRDIRILCQPNPFTTSTMVFLPSARHGAKGMELNIYDASGRLIKSIKLETSTYQLAADLTAGIYFLKLNGTPVGKVVKVR